MLKVVSVSLYLFLLPRRFCSGSETLGLESERGWDGAIGEKSHLRGGSLIGELYVDGWSPIWGTGIGEAASPSGIDTTVDALLSNDVGKTQQGDEITKWDSLQSLGDVKKEALFGRETQLKSSHLLGQIGYPNYDKKETKNLKKKKTKGNSLLRCEVHSGSAWRGSHFCRCVYGNYLVHSDGPPAGRNNEPRGERVPSAYATIPAYVCQPRGVHEGRSFPQRDGPNKSKSLDRANHLLPSLVAGNYEKKRKADKRTAQKNEEEPSENFLISLIKEKRERERSENEEKEEEEEEEEEEGDESLQNDDEYNLSENDDDDEELADNDNLNVYAIEDEVDEESNGRGRNKKRASNRNCNPNPNWKPAENKRSQKRSLRQKKEVPRDTPSSIFNIRRYKNLHKFKKMTAKIFKNMLHAFMYDPDYMDILVYFTTDAADLIMNQ
ncbi:conserved Plasmodium protein, unknown function [Plasmodium vivax]|nr:conserved Plasmodium protein, unknown function [Plasmodium vivax]